MNEFLQYLYNPTTIALVIGGILTSFFGFLAGISKSDKTPNWLAWGSFIAGLLVLCAGIFSGYKDQESASRLQEKAEQIAQISQKNSELSLANSELNKKIANSVTGGDSYCYVIVGNPTKSDTVDLMLKSEGEYPLYDVEIKIHDMEQRVKNLNREKMKNPSRNLSTYDFFSLINKSAKIIKIGNIGPNQGYFLGDIQLPVDSNIARYDMEIMARNGRVLQMVQFRKVNNTWIKAEKIVFNQKVVSKNISPDFPQDAESKYLWNE